MVCASIQAMEEDNEIRDTLSKYAKRLLEDDEEAAPAPAAAPATGAGLANDTPAIAPMIKTAANFFMSNPQ